MWFPLIRFDVVVVFFFGGGGGGVGGGDYSMMIEIAQMALSYYLNKLWKDCFLKHHGQNDLESAAQAHSAICRTVQSVQLIQSAKRV